MKLQKYDKIDHLNAIKFDAIVLPKSVYQLNIYDVNIITKL